MDIMQTLQADTPIFEELKKLSSITGDQEVNFENLDSIPVGIKDEVFNLQLWLSRAKCRCAEW
jgi:hypothetical protein